MLDTVILLKECINRPVDVIDTKIVNQIRRGNYNPVKRNHINSWKLVINFLSILVFIYTLAACFCTVSWPCFDTNDCAVWMVSWNHVTIAIFILISSSTYRKQKLLDCFSIAEGLIRLQPSCSIKQTKSRLKIGYFYFSLVLLLCFKTVISIGSQRNYFVYVLYSISYLVPLSMECLFMILCSVVEDTCYQLKESIKMVEVNRASVLLSLRVNEMIQTHQMAANLLRKINVCFDKDLVIDLVFNMIWLIIYIYVTTVALWKEWENGRKNANLVIESLFLFIRLSFLSYSASRIEFKRHDLLIEIRNFHSSKLNQACVKITNEFLQQVLCNEMKIKVCGLFYINMSFMHGVISLSTTYLIVFIQYGLGNQSSKVTNSTNLTK